MSAAILKWFTAFSYLALSLCVRDCPNYVSYIRPLIETGDVTGLQLAFMVMNNETHSVLTYRVLPVDNTIWSEVTAVKMLISLSKPQLDHIGSVDRWPENNNIRVYLPGAANVFSPTSTYHGGIRYIYNCVTLHARSVINRYKIDLDEPIFKSNRELIYVPLENFVATNGDAMADHISPRVQMSTIIEIVGFRRLTVKECSARQVFFEALYPTVDCFESLKFFSLPEYLEARSASENISEPNKYVPESLSVVKQFFVVMS